MALENIITPASVKLIDRTFRVEINTPYKGEYYISVHRQIQKEDAQGEALGNPDRLPSTNRAFLSVLSETVTLSQASNATISAAEIAEAIELFANRWREEDIVAEAAAEAATAAEAESGGG